jgi:Na+/pantothenate symporter
MEIQIDKDRKLLFEYDAFKIIRDNALIEEHKISSITYTDILKVTYQPQKTNWIKTIFSFLTFALLEHLASPFSGRTQRIEVLLKNDSKRFIDVQSTDVKVAMRIVNEITKRLKI